MTIPWRVGTLSLLIFLVTITRGWSTTVTSQGSGAWESTKTWSGGALPRTSDSVVIRAGDAITINSNVVAATLTFNGASVSASSLSIGSSCSLTLSSSLTLASAAGTDTAATLSGAGKLTCGTVQIGATVQPSSGSNIHTSTLTSTLSEIALTSLNITGSKSSSRRNNSQLLLNSGHWRVSGTVSLVGSSATAVLVMTNGAASGNLELAGSRPFSLSGTTVVGVDGGTAAVTYSGSSQTVYGTRYRNLSLSGSGAKTLSGVTNISGNLDVSGTATATLGGNLTINSNLTVGLGTTLDCGAGNYGLRLGGDWKGSGAFVARAGIVTLLGGNLQTLYVPAAFYHLTVSNANGVALATNTIVNGQLSLLRGRVFAETNLLTVGTNGTIAAAGTASYIQGQAQKIFGIVGAGQAFTFPIGDISAYTPVQLTSLTVRSPGILTARSAHADHPQLGSSGFDLPRVLHRYWTLTQSNGLAATYSAGFNYPSSDLDGSADVSGLRARRYSASGWTNAAAGSIPTATNMSIIGESGFGAFALGDLNSNSAPVAASVTVGRYPLQGVKLAAATVLASAYDAEGDPLTLTVASTTTNGATVALTNNWIFYTPPAGYTNDDAFSYTVTDSRGATGTGIIGITVQADSDPGQNLSVAASDTGHWWLSGNAIPGRSYRVLYSPSTNAAAWLAVPAVAVVPNGNGAFQLDFDFPVKNPQGLFRIAFP